MVCAYHSTIPYTPPRSRHVISFQYLCWIGLCELSAGRRQQSSMKGRWEYVLLALALVITLGLITFNFDSLPALPSVQGPYYHSTSAVSNKHAVVSETFSESVWRTPICFWRHQKSNIHTSDYVPGALVLAHSLRRHNSKSGNLPFDLILVTFASGEKYKNGQEKHLSPRALELLENAGWKIKVTDPIKQASFITPSRFKNNLSALRAFEHSSCHLVSAMDGSPLTAKQPSTRAWLTSIRTVSSCETLPSHSNIPKAPRHSGPQSTTRSPTLGASTLEFGSL